MTDLPAQGVPLPTTDKAAQLANKTLGELTNAAISAAETGLIAAQPWLGWPVIKQIWQKAFSYFVGQLGGALGVYAGYRVVDVQEYLDLKNAAKALAQLNAAKALGDPDEINKASAAADKAVAPILHYVGDSRSS